MQNSFTLNDFMNPANSSSVESSLDSIIETIFRTPIQRPCTYQLEFEKPENTSFQEQTQFIFKQLCYILRKGCSILYPTAYDQSTDKIIPARLAPQNFITIKQYFESFGFKTKNRITQNISFNDHNLIDESFVDSLVNFDIDPDLDNFELPPLPDNENIGGDEPEKKQLKDYVYRIEDTERNITIEISWEHLRT
jgi:hypothetical protein